MIEGKIQPGLQKRFSDWAWQFQARYGVENCFFLTFDAGHQLGVSVSFPNLKGDGELYRHAVRISGQTEPESKESVGLFWNADMAIKHMDEWAASKREAA
jgi:hypothetical protein